MKKSFVTGVDGVYAINTNATPAAIDGIDDLYPNGTDYLKVGNICFFNEDGTTVTESAGPTGDYITLGLQRAVGGPLISAPIYGNDDLKYYSVDYVSGKAKVVYLGSASDPLPINTTMAKGNIYTVIVVDLSKEHWNTGRNIVVTYVTTGAESNVAGVLAGIKDAINNDERAGALGTAAVLSGTYISFTSKASTSKTGYYNDVSIIAGENLAPAGTTVHTPIVNPIGSPYDVALAEKRSANEDGYNPEPMGVEEGMWTNNWLTDPSQTYDTVVIASKSDKSADRRAFDTEANFTQEIEIFVPATTAGGTLVTKILAILAKL